jgi:hypothetical protein
MRFHVGAYPTVDIDLRWKLAVGYPSSELSRVPSGPLAYFGA